MHFYSRQRKVFCLFVCFFLRIPREIAEYINTYIVVRGAAYGAAFAFDTLPPVLANRNDHVRSELQTCGMSYNKNMYARQGYMHVGRNKEIRYGIRAERCQDSYLVPKNSELQAIIFFP